MWKKPFAERSEPEVEQRPEPNFSADGRERALVGPSIVITGGLAGEEDVCIQGRVEGTIDFKGYSVTIGQHGRVKADINAREICVEGKLEGNLHGEERVEIRASGRVIGNIESPRVVMQDGAMFKGSIDMSKREAAKAGGNATHKEALSKMPPNTRTPDTKAGISSSVVKTGTNNGN
ncbi:MAG: polymer-forming cytoskeletal protein [Gammaproteobacteria bacterium]|nr:polymer-forming cytoskeletal protein [Gammaproteobacteria bacterium]